MSALPNDRRVQLLSQSPGGRAVLAEFSAFNPDEWEPHVLSRGPRARQTVFRHVHNKKRYRDSLPPGYIVRDRRILRDDGSALVTGDSSGRGHYESHDPVEVFRSIPEAARLPRKLRLLHAHLADTPDAHPAVRDAVAAARDWADSGAKPESAREATGRIQRAAREASWSGDRWNTEGISIPVRHAVYALHPDEHIDHETETMLDYVLAPHRHAVHASRVANALRSAFYVGGDQSVPVNRDIKNLASVTHASNDRRDLQILADALEEAGARRAVIDNLRHQDSMVRGNWVLDAILNKR